MQQKAPSICGNCKDQIDAFNENEYYGIKYKVYCSLSCFYEDDKKEVPTKRHKEMMDIVNEGKKLLGNKIKAKRPDSEVKNSSQTNKGNKRKNSLQPKRRKSKKRKR